MELVQNQFLFLFNNELIFGKIKYNEMGDKMLLTDAEEINVEELTNNIIITSIVILVLIMVFAVSFWALRKGKK